MKNKIKNILFITQFFFLLLFSNCQKNSVKSVSTSTNNLIIASYNVENLFDTIDDPKTDDKDFLPSSTLQWTPERYQKKLTDINKVLKAIGNNKYPDIFGLVEVENKTVLNDLLNNSEQTNYKIAHKDSPDERGIDVALLYNPEVYANVKEHFLSVNFASLPNDKTRDILYTSGQIGNETIHIFVNHWPSRRGGEKESEPFRIETATILKTTTDSILNAQPNAKIIIMGDFNDYPDNISLAQTLKANRPSSKIEPKQLYNLSYTAQDKNEGSYLHENKWCILDHLIVSGSLIKATKKGGYTTTPTGYHIFKQDWMLYKGEKPNRTYGGNKYFGGYSDHLPVYLVLSKK